MSRSASRQSSRQPSQSPVAASQMSPSRPSPQGHSSMYHSASGRKRAVHARSASHSPAPTRSPGAPGVELTQVEAHAPLAPQMQNALEPEDQGQPVRVLPARRRDGGKAASKHSRRAIHDITSQQTDSLSNSSAMSSSKLGGGSRELGSSRRSRADSLFAPAAQINRSSSWRGAGKAASSARAHKGSLEQDHVPVAASGSEAARSAAGSAQPSAHGQPADLTREHSGRSSSSRSPGPPAKARVDTRSAGRTAGRGARHTPTRGRSAGPTWGKARGSHAGRSDGGGLPRGVGIGRPLY